MIASLAMYDMVALRGANDRLWQAIRARLGHGPDELTRDGDLWQIWQSPDLLMAQTCGMPFRTRLHPKVTLVGTPDYGLPGCPPGYYNSVLVVRVDASDDRVADFSGGRFAYNEPLSQSGWAGPITHLDAAGVRFSVMLQTGTHANSARAVAEGAADIAGLDALTWQLLQDHNSALTDQLRVLETTDPTPALPYITAAGRNPAPIAAAVRAAFGDLPPQDRDALHLKGLVDIPAPAYLAVANPATP
jgi:ABC-type phosphate/phosphonate transport system substrate-binding protein